jgi:WD40 repeat protein
MDDSVRVWETATGETVRTIQHDGVNAALLSPDGSCLLSLSMGGDARLWNTKTGDLLTELRYSENVIRPDCVRDAEFSPKGNRLALCSLRGPVILDATTGKTLIELEGHTGAVRSLSFSADGDWLVSSGEDGTIRKWGAATGEGRKLFAHGSGLGEARFSGDGTRILVRTQDQLVLILDASTGQEVASIELSPPSRDGILFSMSVTGGCAAIGSFDRPMIELRDTVSGLRCAELTGDAGEVRTLSFSPDGRRLVVGALDGPVRVYACDVCGSAEDLRALALKRVDRELTPDERGRALGNIPEIP